MNFFLILNIGNTHTQMVFADCNGRMDLPVRTVDTAAWQSDLSVLPVASDDCQVWVACVVPAAKKILSASNKYKNLYWVDAQSGAGAGLDFSRMDSSTLGADRIANAAALLANGKLPASNFDCGTAITLETVLPGGIFAGGAIMPGRKLMREALAKGTAALPLLALENSLPEELGKNTVQAMTLGIDLGAVGMVRELIKRSRAIGVEYTVASGGDAGFFCQHIPELEAAGELFTLQGICHIAKKHLEKE